ncbi:MAG: hypothetical protein SF182_01530 [Deltaproteobacteria bacterium]|nr:hypothetical protein [Deltaproteobacteria bacterium]
MLRRYGWPTVPLRCAVAAMVLLATSACSSGGASEREQREGESVCRRFGGVERVTACDPPMCCLCNDGARQDYRGQLCAAACSAHDGENPGARTSAWFGWTGGTAECGDGSKFTLSLVGCAFGGKG